MCERCVTQGALVLSDSVTDSLKRFRFWREPTPLEVECGVFELADAIDAYEVDIAKRAALPAKEIVRALVVDASRAVKESDAAAVSRVTPPPLTDLIAAIKEGQKAALEEGRRQVLEQRRKARTELALPPRKNRRLAKGFLSAKAEAEADRIASAAVSEIRRVGLSQVARGVADSETMEEAALAIIEKAVASAATSAARECIAVGRFFAIQDVAQDIEKVVYTALLDANVCDVCADKDGSEYDPEEAGQAPNEDCIGEVYGNVCRCSELVQFYKE